MVWPPLYDTEKYSFLWCFDGEAWGAIVGTYPGDGFADPEGLRNLKTN